MSEDYGMSYDQWLAWQDNLDKQFERSEAYYKEMERRQKAAESFNERFQTALDNELETL